MNYLAGVEIKGVKQEWLFAVLNGSEFAARE